MALITNIFSAMDVILKQMGMMLLSVIIFWVMGVFSTVKRAWPIPNKKIGAIVKSEPVTPTGVSGRIKKVECTIKTKRRESMYRLS